MVEIISKTKNKIQIKREIRLEIKIVNNIKGVNKKQKAE